MKIGLDSACVILIPNWECQIYVRYVNGLSLLLRNLLRRGVERSRHVLIVGAISVAAGCVPTTSSGRH